MELWVECLNVFYKLCEWGRCLYGRQTDHRQLGGPLLRMIINFV